MAFILVAKNENETVMVNEDCISAVHLGKEEFNGRMIQKVTIMVDGRTYTIKEKETIEALAMITKKAGSKLSNQFWAV